MIGDYEAHHVTRSAWSIDVEMALGLVFMRRAPEASL